MALPTDIVSLQNIETIPNNGAFFSPAPGPGQGTLRTPFVDLFIRDQRLPLLDAGAFFDRVIDVNTLTPSTPRLLLLNFSYKLVSDAQAGNEVSMTILDPHWDYLHDILSVEDPTTTPIRINYGWRGIDDRDLNVSPTLHIYNYEVEYQTGFEGARVTLDAVDLGYTLYSFEAGHAFDPNSSISDVIAEVITRVSPNLVPDIETIPIPVGEHNLMTNISPYRYIRDLLEVAKGEQGKSTFTFSYDPLPDGRTQVTIRSDGPTSDIIRKYQMGREKDGTLIRFKPQIVGANYIGAGGAKASAIAVNHQNKNTVVATSVQAEDASTENFKIRKTPLQPGKVYTVPWNKELEGFIQGKRQQVDNYVILADATVHGDTGLIPLRQILVQVFRSDVPSIVRVLSDKSLVHTSGIYRIDSVEHLIQAGTFVTNMKLYRNSHATGGETVVNRQEVNTDIPDPRLRKLFKDVE